MTTTALHLRQHHQRASEMCDAEALLLLVTATFSMPSTSIADMRPEALKKQFVRLYRHALAVLLGKGFNRKSKKRWQPLVYFYVDHPCSSAGTLGRRKRQGPQQHWHIHSLWSVCPRDATAGNRLIDYLNDDAADDLGRPFQTIDARVVPVDDVVTVASYAAKFVAVNQDRPADTLWDVLPTSASEHLTRNTKGQPASRCISLQHASRDDGAVGLLDMHGTMVRSDIVLRKGKHYAKTRPASATKSRRGCLAAALFSFVRRWASVSSYALTHELCACMLSRIGRLWSGRDSKPP